MMGERRDSDVEGYGSYKGIAADGEGRRGNLRTALEI